MFSQLTLATRIMLSFGAFVFLIILLVVASGATLLNLKSDFSHFRDQAEISVLSSNLMEDMAEAHIAALSYGLNGELAGHESVNFNIDEIIEAEAVARAAVDSSATRARFARLQERAAGYRDNVAAAMADNRLSDDEVKAIDAEALSILDGYDRLYEESQRNQKEIGVTVVDNLQSVTLYATLFSALIILIAVLIAFFIIRDVRQNFSGFKKQIKRLAVGETDFDIGGVDRNDEFGELARALDGFRAAIVERRTREQEDRAQKAAQIRKSEALAASIAKFENSIDDISLSLSQSSSDLNAMAKRLSTRMDETNEQSASVASASQEASTSVHTVARVADDLTSSIREIAGEVTDTAGAARTCADAARTSQASLGHLRKAVEDIDGVLQSITGVAEQTNLLALNATIEAARAGDAGKGFAVVAGEVKALANQTHQMTGEISSRVEDVKASANETIRSVTEIIRQIESVDQKTGEIASAMTQQDASTSEMSVNISEAAKGTEEVSRNITVIQDANADTGRLTDDLTEDSNALSAQAQRLRDSVREFLAAVQQ